MLDTVRRVGMTCPAVRERRCSLFAVDVDASQRSRAATACVRVRSSSPEPNHAVGFKRTDFRDRYVTKA